MASGGAGDASVSVTLPESLSRWLDEKAQEDGRSREDVLLQLLSAYRKVEGLEDGEVVLAGRSDDGDGELPAELDAAVERRVDQRIERELQRRVEERLDEEVEARIEAALADRETDGVDRDDIEAVESRFTELLTDVRKRVVQVKREADRKAPADHDHADLVALDQLDALESELSSLTDRLTGLEERLEAGFDNYEDVLEYLADAGETTAKRQTRLARALVETREELRKLAARDAARSAADDLKREASRQGLRTAVCDDCGATVDVGLLTRTKCPHCSATFVDVEPSSGLFGTATLRTGDRPALEAGDETDDGFEYGVSEMIRSADEERPTVDFDDGDGPAGGTDHDEVNE